MEEKYQEPKFLEYLKQKLERNQLLYLISIGNKTIFLKDYSKLVVANGDWFTGPMDFGDEEREIIENPTEEEKIILMTDNVPTQSLIAINKGRELLNTKSKEEALEACQEELKQAQSSLAKFHNAVNFVEEGYTKNEVEIAKKVLEDEVPSYEEIEQIIEAHSERELQENVNSAVLVLNYVNGSLYQYALDTQYSTYLLSSARSEKVQEDQVENTNVEQQEEQTPVSSEVAPVEEKTEETSPVETPTIEPTAPQAPLEENTAVKENSPETPSPISYPQMVEEVVNGNDEKGEISIGEASEILQVPQVPIEPVAPTQEVPVAEQPLPGIVTAPVEPMPQVDIPMPSEELPQAPTPAVNETIPVANIPTPQEPLPQTIIPTGNSLTDMTPTDTGAPLEAKTI